jgi:hypothetical protein
VGDWSDAMYLDKLWEVVSGKDEKDIANFYELLIRMLGACNSDDKDLSIEGLQGDTQRVAANFLAIYTAEAYRAMVPEPHMNWDDALFEVTMVAAFHGAQEKLTKFYMLKFTDQSKEQGSGVYAKRRPGPSYEDAKDKDAELNDYWQFSANPDSKQSGINETRVDFEKMGQEITRYEAGKKNQALRRIQAVVKGDPENVIKSISQFFTRGQSKDVAKIDALAKDVSEFLMNVRDDAGDITDELSK